MPAPTIADLPSAPARTQPATEFAATADAWVAALPTWTSATNSLAAWMEQRAADAEAAAAAAAVDAAAVDLAASQAASGLPLVTGHANQVLTVATDEGSVGWRRALPPGLVLFVEALTAPAGTLKANGALVSRTVYAELFAIIGTRHGEGDGTSTFALPDYRGRFVRALDDGAGIDTDRALGSAQSAQNAEHTHDPGTLAAATGGGHAHAYTFTGLASVSLAGGGVPLLVGSDFTSTSTTTSGTHGHTITGATAAAGGAEARPTNRAALAVITY